MTRIAYTRGLHELGDGLYAYLQPDGGWGWSNAGLIAADGTSLIVDTLFDLRLTRDMLEAMRPVTERSPIGQAMNTHGNGDHWFGNQLLPDGIPIVASATRRWRRCAPTGPQLVHMLFNQLDLGPEFDAFAERNMRRFDFDVGRASAPDGVVRGQPGAAGRRPRRPAARARPGAHRGRLDRLRARRRHRLHRRPAVHRGHADHVGRPGLELDRGVRPDPRARRRA